MISFTHFIFGLALAYFFDKRLVTASAFAIAPDFDITFSFLYPFTHRGITHTLLATAVLSGLVYVYTEDRESAESCALGYSSQLGLDLLTFSGFPLFFPLEKNFSIGLVSAYSFTANSAIIGVSIVLMFLKKHHLVSIDDLKFG